MYLLEGFNVIPLILLGRDEAYQAPCLQSLVLFLLCSKF